MVADLPEEIEVMARTSDNIPMAIKVQNRAIYGVQFHPEAILTENGIEIHTSRIQMIYNEKEFSSHGLSILSDDIFKICVFTAPAVNLMEKSRGDLRKRQNLQWVRH